MPPGARIRPSFLECRRSVAAPAPRNGTGPGSVARVVHLARAPDVPSPPTTPPSPMPTPASPVGPLLVALGLVLVVVGLVAWWGGLAWFGRLPGDVRYERGAVRVYAPIVSMLLVSVVLSVAAALVRRFLR